VASSVSAVFSARRWPKGLFWIIPVLEWTQRSICVAKTGRHRTAGDDHHRTCVTLQVTSLLWYKISDPKKAVMRSNNYGSAFYQVAMTSRATSSASYALDESA